MYYYYCCYYYYYICRRNGAMGKEVQMSSKWNVPLRRTIDAGFDWLTKWVSHLRSVT